MNKMLDRSNRGWLIDYWEGRLVEAIAADLRLNTPESRLHVIGRRQQLAAALKEESAK